MLKINQLIRNIQSFRHHRRYERMIAESQAHLASIPVTHGHTNVHA